MLLELGASEENAQGLAFSQLQREWELGRMRRTERKCGCGEQSRSQRKLSEIETVKPAGGSD
jgi:hypothetical protein